MLQKRKEHVILQNVSKVENEALRVSIHLKVLFSTLLIDLFLKKASFLKLCNFCMCTLYIFSTKSL